MLKGLIEVLAAGQDLSEDQAMLAFAELLDEKNDDEDRLKFLKNLANKGESVEEISGFVRGMMERCSKIDLGGRGLDLCGTGGSGLERFNVSTTVAFVLASMGIPIVKHGNRGSHKSNGSFDLLEALCVPFDLSLEEKAKQFQERNLCFLFARAHHPAVKAVGPARAKLGRRTIFNLVGPLCNPAEVKSQVLGVSDALLGPKMAEVLCRLNRGPSVVVHGAPGIDEFSLSGTSKAWWVRDGEITEKSYEAKDFGLSEVSWDDLPKGDAKENSKIFMEIIAGGGNLGLRAMVALNAAAGIVLMKEHLDLKTAFKQVMDHMESGAVLPYFESLLS
jgi:anthranilate phosphoribosyltransferase